MTPKEKAKELIDKYSIYGVMWTGGIAVERQNVKQCASIAVDEIIEALSAFGYSDTTWDDFETGKMTFMDGGESPEHYWQKVKEEIEKL